MRHERVIIEMKKRFCDENTIDGNKCNKRTHKCYQRCEKYVCKTHEEKLSSKFAGETMKIHKILFPQEDNCKIDFRNMLFMSEMIFHVPIL